MGKQALLAGGIAVLVVAGAIAILLSSTRKNRVDLTGEILKVRSHQLDPEHTLALIDIRIHNPSTQQFVVRDAQVFVDEPDGKSSEADVFAESDIQRLIGYYPTLGKKYNPGVLRKDKINSGQTVDRTMSVSAPMTDERLTKRKRLRIVIHDVDGPTIEIAERR